MKTILFTFILTLYVSFAQAQCTENVSNFGNNTAILSYNITGAVNVTLNTNETATVNFGRLFETAEGPDVRVYLMNSEDKPSSEIKNIRTNTNGDLIFNDGSLVDNLEFGLIEFSGPQSYTVAIPEDKNVSNYDTIFFFCLRFDQFWDYGNFNSFTDASCAVLSVNDLTLNKSTIYPNPAQDQFEITNINNASSNIRVYNILGEQVIYQKNRNTIDVSSLKPGSYFVKISTDNKTTTEKLIVQ